MLVIPVYDMIIAPDATLYLQTEQIQRCSAGKDLFIGEKVILIAAKENTSYQSLNENSFFPIGASGSITDVDKRGFVTIRTDNRVNVEEVSFDSDRMIAVSVSRREEIDDLSHDLEAEN